MDPTLIHSLIMIVSHVRYGKVPSVFSTSNIVLTQDWKHGAVFVNGFNIGRYYSVGPQKSLYIPGPLLKQGSNEIIVFENYLGSDTFKFTDTPNYGTPSEESSFTIHSEL